MPPVATIPGPASIPGAIIEDDELMREFHTMLNSDGGAAREALKAANEMRNTPWDEWDKDPEPVNLQLDQEGVVSRRGPMNPFHSKKMGKFQIKGKGSIDHVTDPASFQVPLRGRLIATMAVNTSLMFIFFQELIYNKLQTGEFYVPADQNSMIGPAAQTLYDLGGLNSNAVRAGDWIRLFWAMWMHAGWLHIGFNVLCQLQFMYMLEPDWGFWRTLLTFGVAGMSGNFLSSVVDPCKTSVGSSGGLFGLIGGLSAFVIEYWNTIPRPIFFLCFTLGVGIISILTGLTQSTDSWAHIGGLLGGVLFGFGTITTLRPFLGDKINPTSSGNMFWRWLKWKCSPRCTCGYQEWIVRAFGLGTIIVGWGVLAHFLWGDVYYQSLGSITFKGMQPCCCCFDLKTYDVKNKTSWACYICELPYFSHSSQPFGEYCDEQNAKSRRILLPEVEPFTIQPLSFTLDRDNFRKNNAIGANDSPSLERSPGSLLLGTSDAWHLREIPNVIGINDMIR